MLQGLNGYIVVENDGKLLICKKEDEQKIITELIQLKPFQHTPGRRHDSFPDIKRTPLKYLDYGEFMKWVNEKIEEWVLPSLL